MSEITNEVLEKIKQDKIQPRPRWEFLMKDYVVWSLFAIFVVLGGLAVSVIIFMLTSHDWDIYRYLDKSFIEYFLLSVPYFWIILIFGILAIAWLDFRNTKKGYKYDFAKIGLINIVASILLGVVFYYSGVGLKIEQVFSDNLPFYQAIHPMRKADVWENPDKGLLIGEITDIIDDQTFNLRDLNNENWIVSCIKCLWRGGLKKEQGMVVKVLGEKTSEDTFQVFDVRPWRVDCDQSENNLDTNHCRSIGMPPPPPKN